MSNIWNNSNIMYVNNTNSDNNSTTNSNNNNNNNQTTNPSSQINAILLSNTNTIDQNNNNNNKLEDKKRQLHLPLGENEGGDDKFSAKKLKLNTTTNSTPTTLTPLLNLDTPSLIQLSRLHDDFQLPTPIFETKIGDIAMTPTPVYTIPTLPFTFPTQTPEVDVGNKLQRALEDVKRKDTTSNGAAGQLSLINYQMQNTNQNQNLNYTQLTNVPSNLSNIYLINTPDQKLTGNVIIMPINQSQQQSLQQQAQQHHQMMQQHQHQQQQQQQHQQQQQQQQQPQAEFDDKKLLNINEQPYMIGKEEPQTVPVHTENGTEHLTTLTNATTTTLQTTLPASSTNTSRKTAKKVANKLPSSNSSSPTRRNTRSSSTSSTLNQSSQDQLSISPIDLDQQEVIKIEKKRERNREAARKCRTRKLEKIAQLEGQVKDLSDLNTRITDQSNALKDEINRLRSQLQEHRQHGCEVPLNI